MGERDADITALARELHELNEQLREYNERGEAAPAELYARAERLEAQAAELVPRDHPRYRDLFG